MFKAYKFFGGRAIFKTSGGGIYYLSDIKSVNESINHNEQQSYIIIMLFKPEITNSILRAAEGSSMLGIRVGMP